MMKAEDSSAPLSPAAADFAAAISSSLANGSFLRLSMGAWQGTGADIKSLSARVVQIKGTRHLSVVTHHKTRDVTQNIATEGAGEVLAERLRRGFKTGRLLITAGDVRLDWSRKAGQWITRSSSASRPAPDTAHDRTKKRLVQVSAPFLSELGVTNAKSSVLPSMSHKWKQINKFLEIFERAVAESDLPPGNQVKVVDFGSGKGYLTFAAHHHLQSTQGRTVDVLGVERRTDLVEASNAIVSKLGLEGLRFIPGDLNSCRDVRPDILIALHACDTATDEAIALGIQGAAAVILCAPCCHKEIRPQLHLPQVLRPLLRFGIHAACESEMITDSIRALLMEAHGYSAHVFEFISQEHTDKNKMILGIRKSGRPAQQRAIEDLAALKDFYGIREQNLERLLGLKGRA